MIRWGGSCSGNLDEFATSDGKNMTPLLQGEDIELHRVGVTEHPWSKSVRKGPWRFVYYPRDMFGSETVGELYNLQNDPWEIHNLFYDKAYASVIEEMRGELLDWTIQSHRVVTAHPPLPSPDADGKVSAEHVRALCRGGALNYL